MHNYKEAINLLEVKIKQQKDGYVYIYNSPLEGEERLQAIGKVKSRILQLTQALETLIFLNK